MFNILYICNDVKLGGATQSLLDMLKALDKRNIRPVVIIPDNGVIEGRLNEIGVVYYVVNFTKGYGRIGAASKRDEDNDFINNYSAALQLLEIIQTEKIDLIHINSSVSNVGAIAALMADIPYVWHIRELLEELYGQEYYDKQLKKSLFSYTDVAIAISDTVAETFKKKYEIDIVTIYNGLDVERYKKPVDICEMDTSMHRFMITGDIIPAKGQYDAIRAVNLLVKEGIRNIHLTLAGSGQERFRWILKQYVRKNGLQEYVTIMPFQKELSELREKTQYSLTTSKMEGLGRCTIEAMLAGKLVIGADTGGTKEIIGEDESKGYLYRQGDYESLASVMKSVMNKSVEEKMSCLRSAQWYAEETFSPDKYVEQLSKVYEEVYYNRKQYDRKEIQQFLSELKIRYDNISIQQEPKSAEKSKYMVISEQWDKIKDTGYGIADYLKKNGYKRIAIYGMGNLGSRLYEELTEAGIEALYVIDRDRQYIEDIITVIDPDEQWKDVDIVIVAVANAEQDIMRRYQCKGYSMVGLSEVLNNMEETL